MTNLHTPLIYYLAACFRRQVEMRSLRVVVNGYGGKVNSRWLDVTEEFVRCCYGDHWQREMAAWDQEDIRESDALVIFTEEPGRGQQMRTIGQGLQKLLARGQPEGLRLFREFVETALSEIAVMGPVVTEITPVERYRVLFAIGLSRRGIVRPRGLDCAPTPPSVILPGGNPVFLPSLEPAFRALGVA